MAATKLLALSCSVQIARASRTPASFSSTLPVCASLRPHAALELSARPSLITLQRREARDLSVNGSRKRTGVCRASFGSVPSSGALTPELKEALDKYVNEHKVLLFMKGNKMFPQCGFSNTCVQILNTLEVPYETVNILENDQLRQGMKEFSSWPTFPQLYIDGEFFGGCDITIEAFQSGELKEAVDKAMLS